MRQRFCDKSIWLWWIYSKYLPYKETFACISEHLYVLPTPQWSGRLLMVHTFWQDAYAPVWIGEHAFLKFRHLTNKNALINRKFIHSWSHFCIWHYNNPQSKVQVMQAISYDDGTILSFNVLLVDLTVIIVLLKRYTNKQKEKLSSSKKLWNKGGCQCLLIYLRTEFSHGCTLKSRD